jgi:hypothetical protein
MLILTSDYVLERSSKMSVEDKLVRRRELKEKSRKRKRGPYRKASSGRLIKY